MSKAVIVSAVRTAMGKGRKGTLRTVRPDDLGALVIGEAVKRATGLQSQDVDDVLMGCAIPEGEQGMNVARVASLRAGLPASVPAATINRFCSSGLQTIAMAVDAVASGRAHAVVAGGTESMSRVAMFARSYPNPQFAKEWAGVYLAMGLTAENLAKQYGISREESDAFSLQSHQKAAGAIVADKFAAEIVPVPVEIHQPSINGPGGNAVPKALEQAGLSLDDIDIIELNEAFSVQALSVIKELGLPLEKVNVNGGAVALGHPLGATGARLVVTALNELERRGARRALITMCVGGGMGAAGIIER